MSTINLFTKQQETVDKIINILNHKKDYPLLENSVYLAGEMGVGKTYMGAYLANHYKKLGYNILLIVPHTTINKWLPLLEEPSLLGKNDIELNDGISVVTIKDSNLWSFEKLIKNNGSFDKKTVLIYDEIHLAINTKWDALDRIVKNIKANVQDYKCIYLTGTLLEGNKKIIAKLLKSTHPKISKKYKVEELLSFNKTFAKFVYTVLQNISVSISLEDVQTLESNREEIKQEMLPIVKLDVSIEQNLFLNVVKNHLKALNTGDQSIKNITVSYLDNPQQSLDINKKQRPSKTFLPSGANIHLALPLSDFDIKNTEKFKHLLNLIKNSNGDKILIYANDEPLIQILKNELSALNIDAFTIENVKAENYSEYINEQFKTHKIAIVDPLKVNVGIDIHAEQLVWYQMMPRLDKMIQAQRRVCRLSSKSKSIVTLMAYDIDFEMEKAIELSNASKHNALTYGVKQQDNLAKLTGILLGGIK